MYGRFVAIYRYILLKLFSYKQGPQLIVELYGEILIYLLIKHISQTFLLM